jgi:GAF domain-containing protein
MPSPPNLLDVLTRFARTLAGRYDLSDVLFELSDRTAELLGAAGAGVCLGDSNGHLQFVTATSESVSVLEQVQAASQRGPCHDAYKTGEVVVVADLATCEEWPDYAAVAQQAGMSSVVGIPMLFDRRPFGALNIYHARPREWRPYDLELARVLADIATGYVAHASELDQARRVNEQLTEALDNRIVIEQAKGLLAGQRNITLDAPFDILRRHARNNHATLRDIAQAVVELRLSP